MNQILLIIVGAVAGVVIKEALKKENLVKIRNWLSDRVSRKQIVAPADIKSNTSIFASRQEAFESVLKIRRAVFGKLVLTTDDDYIQLAQKNPVAFKLVHKGADPIGYWSVVPVSRNTYFDFLENKKNHAEVLQESLAWKDVPGEVYLYIVGIVVSDNASMKSAIVIYDMYSFANNLFAWSQGKRLAGICGYPSRDAGLNLFRLARGFLWNGNCRDGKKNQRIYVCEGSDLGAFDELLKDQLDSAAARRFIPTWLDKEVFFRALPPSQQGLSMFIAQR
jgi:hypothetical protein